MGGIIRLYRLPLEALATVADFQNSVSCFSSLWGPDNNEAQCAITNAAADELLKLGPFVGHGLAATPAFLEVVEDGLPTVEAAGGPVVLGIGVVLVAPGPL